MLHADRMAGVKHRATHKPLHVATGYGWRACRVYPLLSMPAFAGRTEIVPNSRLLAGSLSYTEVAIRQETMRQPSTRASMKPPHILIVDDEDDFRGTLNILLSMEGFHVSEASSGDQAICLIDAGLRPDVLLLDYRMPGLNGGQTLDHIRRRAVHVPAVLLTAASEAHHLARQHDFDAVLRKPVGPDDLLATLKKTLPPS